MTTENTAQPSMPPIKLAFVLDGEVADVLHTDERLAAIFSSNPLVINVTTEMESNPEYVLPGATYDYDTNTFTNPERLLKPGPQIVEDPNNV